MDNLDKVTIEMLRGEQREIAECIGLDVYLKLVRRFGGCQIYIAKPDKVAAGFRDEQIRAEFNGFNFSVLAAKYGLTERTIREIVRPCSCLEGQTDMFGEVS